MITRRLVLTVPLILAASLFGAAEGKARADRTLPWVTEEVAAPGLMFGNFDSTVVGTKVSFHIYAPPAYERDQARLPVLYWLHGTAGGVRGVRPVSQLFANAMASGEIPTMLLVFVNGLPSRLWCDSKDGASPVETVFIQELIPHVDKNYRTISSREGRILEGFSMGGYGAGRIGLKHPDLFAGISMLAAGPLDPQFRGPRAEKNPGQRELVLRTVCSGDLEYFRQQGPWAMAETMASKLAQRKTVIQVVVGDQDASIEDNRKFHEWLKNLKIDHEFVTLPGVEHDTKAVFAGLGQRSGQFYRRVLQTR
ncbi:esterase family protein [bacterium]|nr:esterase family protein [bacterium]